MIDAAALEHTASVRRDLLRRRRLAGRAGPHQPLGAAAGDLPGIRPVRQHPAGPACCPASRARSGMPPARTWTGWWSARTARASTPGIGGRNLAGRGRGQGGRHSGGPLHRGGLRAGHPLRLQPGPDPQAEEGHQRHQVERPAVRHGPLGRGIPAGEAEFPDVETEQWLVDAMAARFVLRPDTLEVVVASNLFADILSDLGSALAGSLGHRGQRQPEPGAALPEHVRAGPRLGAGHRRARASPTRSRADLERGADARAPRATGGSADGHARHRVGDGGRTAHARPGRHLHHPRGRRRASSPRSGRRGRQAEPVPAR